MCGSPSPGNSGGMGWPEKDSLSQGARSIKILTSSQQEIWDFILIYSDDFISVSGPGGPKIAYMQKVKRLNLSRISVTSSKLILLHSTKKKK